MSFSALVAFGVCVLRSVVGFRIVDAKWRIADVFRKLLAAISEAQKLHKPLKRQDFVYFFEIDVLIARVPQMPFELGFGSFFVVLWPFWGPLVALFCVLRALRRALVLVAAWFLSLSQA